MRYNVSNLQQLKDAVDEMSADDRIVLFTDEGPFRFRIKVDSIEKHECDAIGASE